MEDGFHHFRIAGDLLLLAVAEALDFQVGQQALNLVVGQLATLDACGRADAFDGGHMAQRLEALRREGAQSAPRPLELVNLTDQSQQLRGDLNGLRLHDAGIYTGLCWNKPKALARLCIRQGTRRHCFPLFLS